MGQQQQPNKANDDKFEERMGDIESRLEVLGTDIMRERHRTKVEITNAVNTVSTVQGLPGASGVDGSEGVSARGVSLSVTDQTIEFNTNGDDPSPTSVTFTSAAVNSSSTVYYEFFLDDVSQQNTTDDYWEYDTHGLTYSDMPKKVECQIREDSSTGLILARDQINLQGLMAGSDAVTTVLSNDAHTMPVTVAGVIDYTGSGTDIEVWVGTTQLSYGTGDMEYQVTATSTNITASTPTTEDGTDGGDIRRYPDHSGSMPANTDLISYAIAVKNEAGVSMHFTRVQTFSKSWEGAAGVDGINVDVAFNFQTDDTYSDLDASGDIADVNDGVILTSSGWDYTENWDINNNIDSSYIFTAPKDGIYFFSAELYVSWYQITSGAGDHPRCRVAWDVSTNGGTTWTVYAVRAAASDFKGLVGATAAQAWWWPYVIKPLAEDSQIRVRLCCDNIYTTGSYGATVTAGSEFAGHLITPEYPV
jgi:hypothetical protein